MKPSWDLFTWSRRHPFAVGALALHLAGLAGLYLAGPYALRQQQGSGDRGRVSEALQSARRAQMQHHLDQLQKLAQELNLPPPAGAASQPPVQAAQDLVKRLEAAAQLARAKELARLLKITPEQALAKLKAEDAKRLRPLAQDPAQALAQLNRRARDAADRLREQARREASGTEHRVAQGPAGPAGRGPAADGLGPAGAGAGRGQGRSGGESVASLGGLGEPERVYEAPSTPPPLDAASLRFAEARRFGPGAAFANRVYLDRWNVVGPFAAPSSRALGDVLAPELAVDLDAVYEGKHGLVSWQPQHSANYPFVPEPREPDALYYAATELQLDRAMDVWLDLGVDDDAKLWVNDELVWVSGNADKAWYHRPFYRLDDELGRYALVESRVKVHLNAGRNTLLLKLYNGVDLMFFSVVLAR